MPEQTLIPNYRAKDEGESIKLTYLLALIANCLFMARLCRLFILLDLGLPFGEWGRLVCTLVTYG